MTYYFNKNADRLSQSCFSGFLPGRLLLLLLAAVLAGSGDDKVPATNIECIRDMGVPTFTSVARRAHEGGVVTVIVTPDSAGKAARVAVSGPQKDLGEEVQMFLEDDTTYQPGCAGKPISLVFEFRVEGQPEQCPLAKVRFKPPNQFVITSAPRLPAFASPSK